MKLDPTKDAKNFVVLEISKISNTDELKIKILVDQEEFDFILRFSAEPLEILGVQIPGKLEHLTLDYLYHIRDFFNLLFAAHEGEEVKLPQALRCWQHSGKYTSNHFSK